MKTIILIPPSEGKADGGNNTPLKSASGITADLIEAIKEADPKKLYGLKEKALEKAITVNKEVLSSKTMPAIERYTGEFILKKAGKKMPAGHQGKHIKGRFVRWLIEKNITDPKHFKDFKEEGCEWTGAIFLKEV